MNASYTASIQARSAATAVYTPGDKGCAQPSPHEVMPATRKRLLISRSGGEARQSVTLTHVYSSTSFVLFSYSYVHYTKCTESVAASDGVEAGEWTAAVKCARVLPSIRVASAQVAP